jgi:N utilization substance protein B
MKSARRRAREFATQGLYQWLLSGASHTEIETQLRGADGFDKADKALFDTLVKGVIRDADTLSEKLQPLLDRPIKELSPVERAVLLIGAFELLNQIDVP